MKNLKRILSLALAGTMLAGMMVVGASAASFKDEDTITKNTAVDTLVTLNVISGKEDGSFDPKGDVTRAEMATMIAIALHGGEKDFRGTTNAGFTDTVGHWASKYIKYCVDQGILSGRGDGTFDPDSNVTAQEAIVMMLLAMGYRKEIFANVGGDWAAKYNDKAEKLGLYDDTDVIDYTATVNRENAAQIIYNGINRNTPRISDTYNVLTGEHTYTVQGEDLEPLLTSKFGVKVEYTVITGTAIDNGTYNYTVDSAGIDLYPYDGKSLTAKIDVSDLFLQKVRVIYSGNQVLGITAAVDGILGEGIYAGREENENKNTIDGKKVEGKLEDLKAYAFNDYSEPAKDIKGYYNYSLIDSNGNGLVDAMVVYPFTVEQVGRVGKTTATIGGKSYELKNIEVEGKLAQGDYVKHTTAIDGTATFEVLDILEDRVASAKDKDGNYTIGGAKYPAAETGALAAVDTLGHSYDLVVVNGHVFASWQHEGSNNTAAGVDKIVYATRVNDPTAPTDEFGTVTTDYQTQRVELLFNDNSKQAVTVTKVDGKKVEKDKIAAEDGVFYTYSIDSDGNYQLTTMDRTGNDWNGLAKADVDGYTIKDSKATKAGSTTYRFSDNAVIYVFGDKGIKVYTGAEIAKWSKSGTEVEKGELYTAPNASGFLYTSLGIVSVKGAEWPDAVPSTSGIKYGYLTKDTETVFDTTQNKEFARLTIWTGEEEVTYLADASLDITKYDAGKMISYKVDNKNMLTDATVIDEATTGKKVTAYDGANTIQFEGTAEYSLKDAIIIYIDKVEKTGAEEGSIQLATEDPTKDERELLTNVWILTNEEKGTVTVMFVDVNNGLQ